jgi:hypothetical protein
MTTNTPTSVDELYDYLSNLETINAQLLAEVQTLKAEKRALRRSITSFKANATRRRNMTMTVSA